MKVLVVDDERDVEFLYTQRFRREMKDGKIDLSFAFSADEALDKLNTNSYHDVLVLSDINMPGMTGLEMLQVIKHDHPGTKVIMISAYGDETNFNKAKQYGADDFFTKPVDFVNLKDRLFAE
ncbi:MAG: response regulator [Bacteroidetes bacterium]|nr:response regulator [Bacteroidota bacterium]